MWLTPRAKRVSAQSVGQAQSEGLAMSMRGQASRPSQASQQDGSQIDLTPMLDVVFIMLIFFIVTTVFVKEAGIEVNKPEASEAFRPKNANIFIAVTEDGDVWLDKRQVDPDSIRANVERLLTEQPTDYVIIQADVKAKHGLVVKIMDQVKDAGIDKISVASRS